MDGPLEKKVVGKTFASSVSLLGNPFWKSRITKRFQKRFQVVNPTTDNDNLG